MYNIPFRGLISEISFYLHVNDKETCHNFINFIFSNASLYSRDYIS